MPRRKATKDSYLPKFKQSVSSHNKYFAAIYRATPEVFDDLRSKVYPVFLEACNKGPEEYNRAFMAIHGDGQHPLLESVKDWARAWGLRTIYFNKQLIATFNSWMDSGTNLEDCSPAFSGHVEIAAAMPSTLTTFGFNFNPYEESADKTPLLCTFSNIDLLERDIREKFERELAQWKEKCIEHMSGVHVRREKATTEREKHFEWLALYQCKRMSIHQIARAKGRSYNTVKNGILQACEDLGISYEAVPKKRGGRPRKTVQL